MAVFAPFQRLAMPVRPVSVIKVGRKSGSAGRSAHRADVGRARHNELEERYRPGTLAAIGVRRRTGDDRSFGEYLIERLRASDKSSGPSLRPVPTFTASTLEGVKVDQTALRGKVTVVDFWFIGCPLCKAERPKLNELAAEHGDRVRFLSFALDKPEDRT